MAGHSRSKNGVASLAYVPAIHVLATAERNNVDHRAFAAPKGLRPRRRDKPGDDVVV